MDRNYVQPLSAASAERLDRLFRLYGNRILGVARTQTRDADAAQDVAMDTWVRAGRSLHTLRADDEHAFSWLCTIVRHTAAEYYRRYERPEDWTDAVTSRRLPSAASAEDVALADEPTDVDSGVFPELDDVLALLPEQDRTVVALRVREGLTFAAIGNSYDRSDGAAYWRYHRALRTLRSAVAA